MPVGHPIKNQSEVVNHTILANPLPMNALLPNSLQPILLEGGGGQASGRCKLVFLDKAGHTETELTGFSIVWLSTCVVDLPKLGQRNWPNFWGLQFRKTLNQQGFEVACLNVENFKNFVLDSSGYFQCKGTPINPTPEGH